MCIKFESANSAICLSEFFVFPVFLFRKQDRLLFCPFLKRSMRACYGLISIRERVNRFFEELSITLFLSIIYDTFSSRFERFISNDQCRYVLMCLSPRLHSRRCTFRALVNRYPRIKRFGVSYREFSSPPKGKREREGTYMLVVAQARSLLLTR